MYRGERMIKKLTLNIVCLGVLMGCAGTQPQTTFVDNTFTSDLPKLKVQILKDVLSQQEKSQQRGSCRSTVHSYTTGPAEVVGIAIWRCVLDSNTEWRSSNEQLVRQIGGLPLDPITFNNKSWVKFVQLNEKGIAAFGYFTRMDDNLVTVYSLIKAEQYKDDIESFAKTRVLSERLKRLINQAFDEMEKLFVIDSYERLYKDKSGKESFKKQGRRESEFGKEIVYTDYKIQFNELKNWKKLNPKLPNMILFGKA